MPSYLKGNLHGNPGDGPPIVTQELSEKLHLKNHATNSTHIDWAASSFVHVGISLSDWIGCNDLEELKTNLFDLFGINLDTFSLVYC